MAPRLRIESEFAGGVLPSDALVDGRALRDYLDQAIQGQVAFGDFADGDAQALADHAAGAFRLVRRAVFGDDVLEPLERATREWVRARFWPHAYTSRMDDGHWSVRLGRLELWGDADRSLVNAWLQRWSRRRQSRYLWLRLRIHFTPERVYWPDAD